MRALFGSPVRFQPRAQARRFTLLLGIVAVALLGAGGCAQQPERASPSATSPPAASPWALPTSTMRWNEYACDLIARNAIGQFPASRTLAYMNLAINNAIVVA